MTYAVLFLICIQVITMNLEPIITVNIILPYLRKTVVLPPVIPTVFDSNQNVIQHSGYCYRLYDYIELSKCTACMSEHLLLSQS